MMDLQQRLAKLLLADVPPGAGLLAAAGLCLWASAAGTLVVAGLTLQREGGR